MAHRKPQAGLKVREATGGDVDTLVEFNLRMAAETEARQLDPAVLRAGVQAVLRNSGLGFYLIAEADGNAAGSLMVTTEWSDWRNATFWWVQSVYVAPECRRHGVLRALYEAVRERARQSGQVCGCRLYVERDNAAAQAAYVSLGMQEARYRLFEQRL